MIKSIRNDYIIYEGMLTMKKLFALMLAMALMLTVAAAYAADLTITNATLGQTYQAFKVFNAYPSDETDLTKPISYTATDAQIGLDGFTDIFEVAKADGVNIISVKSDVDPSAVIHYIMDNIDDLKQGAAISGEYSNNSTYKFSNLDNGYYFVTSTLGSFVTIDSAGTNVQIVDKNESQPEEPEKFITDEDSAVDEDLDETGLVDVKENDASVGSVETFSVTFQAVNWIQDEETNTAGTGEIDSKTQVTVYKFEDAPTGLAIDKTTLKVTVNGQEIQITDAEVDSNGKLTFTIPWVDDSGKSLYETKTDGSAKIPVVVTYKAKVTAAAATAAAPNEVTVRYNNDVELGKDTTTTYTYKFRVEKTDQDKAPLDGAEFELYYGNGEGSALTFTLENGVYRFDPEGSETRIKPTGADATALIIGLDRAQYMLKEVVVPAGYNKAPDTEVDGLSKVDTADDSSHKITIENNKGSELPSTGGVGTTIFYVVGGLLIIGAAIVLVARRKAHE